MNKGNRLTQLFVLLLLLMSLACNFSAGLPFLGSQDEGISPEDVSIAATRAAEVAATAAAVSGEAGQIVATAVTQGDELVATAIAPGGDNIDTDPPAVDAPVTGTALEQKLANIQPDANGNFAVAITEADLNEFIAGQGGAIQTDSFGAQDIQFKITPEHLEFTGDVTEPIALPLVVRLRPSVVDDRLQFELLSASAGIFPVPETMLDLIETVSNSELSRALINLPAGVTLQDATLANGEFTVFGHEN